MELWVVLGIYLAGVILAFIMQVRLFRKAGFEFKEIEWVLLALWSLLSWWLVLVVYYLSKGQNFRVKTKIKEEIYEKD